MSNHTIPLTLDPQSIGKAQRQLAAYKKELQNKIALLMTAIAQEGAEILRNKIVSVGAVMFGDLLASVSGVYVDHVAIIGMGTDHAAFIEFGVGVQGQRNPHPDPPPGWKYDSNNHGEEGWWYFGDWDNNWHWTNGYPSRPVLWETSREVPALARHLIAEVFR